ncbi:hypothetical protein [Saccharothrix lopnurensis]|uniref:Protein-L-isoaspartate O-methyltransferase n=1 Tax=Saccharothrix lopnurensis TaxID=1670621 RepID=A0ABW1PEM8_9PSEU
MSVSASEPPGHPGHVAQVIPLDRFRRPSTAAPDGDLSAVQYRRLMVDRMRHDGILTDPRLAAALRALPREVFAPGVHGDHPTATGT